MDQKALVDQKALMDRRDVWRREVAMSISLLPFALVSAPLFPGAFLGWIVFVIGVATHMSCAYEWRYCDYMRVADTTTNVFLCVLVNVITTWQPQSIILTILASLAWVLNSPRKQFEYGNCVRSWVSRTFTATSVEERKQARSAIVHIVCVQWTLCVVLLGFQHGL